MNVGEILTTTANKFPGRIAVVLENQILTYQAFNERINQFAQLLLGLGLKKREKVAVLLFNSIPLV